MEFRARGSALRSWTLLLYLLVFGHKPTRKLWGHSADARCGCKGVPEEGAVTVLQAAVGSGVQGDGEPGRDESRPPLKLSKTRILGILLYCLPTVAPHSFVRVACCSVERPSSDTSSCSEHPSGVGQAMGPCEHLKLLSAAARPPCAGCPHLKEPLLPVLTHHLLMFPSFCSGAP